MKNVLQVLGTNVLNASLLGMSLLLAQTTAYAQNRELITDEETNESIEQGKITLPEITWPTKNSTNQSPAEKTTEQKRLFVINLHIPSNTKASALCAYYKGCPLQLSNALCILPETEKRLTFSYVITEEVDLKARGNTVQCLRRKPSLPCTWYDLTLKIDDSGEESTYEWTVEQKKTKDMPLNLPDHAILIQTSPCLIDKIKSTQKTTLESDIIYLPTIFLKENCDCSQQSICAVIDSINVRTTHREPEKTYHIPNNRTSITIPATLPLCSCLCKR